MIIGSLAVNIIANVDKFSAGLNKARKGLKGFVGTSVSQMGSLHTAMGGIVAGSAAQFIKATIDQGSALQDTSEKLGITTEALQKMRFVSDQLGASTSSMERSLGFLTKNLGNAANGSPAAIKAFEKLGLSVDSLKNQSIDVVFMQVADAIKQLPTPAEQAAAATRLLGKAGMDLLPMLRSGSAEMQRLADELERAGGIASGESISALETLGDQIGVLTTTFSALKLEIVATFGPAIKFALEDTINKLRVLKTILDSVRSSVKTILGGLAGMPGFPQHLLPKPPAIPGAPAAPVPPVTLAPTPTSARVPSDTTVAREIKESSKADKETAKNTGKLVTLVTELVRSTTAGPQLVGGTIGG